MKTVIVGTQRNSLSLLFESLMIGQKERNDFNLKDLFGT